MNNEFICVSVTQALFTARQACREHFCFVGNDTSFLDMSVFEKPVYVLYFLLFVHLFDNTNQTRNLNTLCKIVEFAPELSHFVKWP